MKKLKVKRFVIFYYGHPILRQCVKRIAYVITNEMSNYCLVKFSYVIVIRNSPYISPIIAPILA